MIWHLLRRDLGLFLPGGRQGSSALPLLFFIAIAMLYPFAVGPDPILLGKSGGGVIWIAALLAAILPLDRLFAPDLDTGVFDQMDLRGITAETAVAVRLLAHWISFAPLLIIASFPAAALLGLDGPTLHFVLLGLMAGTPGLAAAGVLIAALTAGLRGGTALSGLLLIPLAVPILIFGAGALVRQEYTPLALCGAVSLLLVAITPFIGGAALRSAREG